MDLKTDLITIEVVRNELEALTAEMKSTIRRTARSAMAKAGDISIALTDGNGNNIGVGQQTVVTALFDRIAKHLIAQAGEIRPGDAFFFNDPYSGGAHLPDIFVIRPIFHEGERVAIALCYSHHSDVGGRFPGSQTGRGESIFEEGIRIPFLRVEAAGVRNREVLALAAANVRPEQEFVGDIEAKLAGLKKAEANLLEIIGRYGVQALLDCETFLGKRCTDEFSAVLAAIPPGHYSSEAFLHDDGRGPVEDPITVRLTLAIGPDGIVADFAGTDPQVDGGINMPFSNAYGVVANAIRELLIPDMPLASSYLRMLDIRAPEGSLVNPSFPAAVAGRAPVFLVVDELVHLCLAKAQPDRIPALREAWDVLHFSKRTAAGQLSLMDLFSGGWGGRPDAEGIDGVCPAPTITIGAEILEREYPLVIEGFGLVPDTAGAGRHRGSLAIFRRYRFLEDASIMVRTTKLRPSSGINGGSAGSAAAGRAVLDGEPREMGNRTYDHLKVQPGDRYYHQTAGAGGFGDPFERDPEAVLRDVVEGRLSAAVAERDYGVAIGGLPAAIDTTRTAALREQAQIEEGAN